MSAIVSLICGIALAIAAILMTLHEPRSFSNALVGGLAVLCLILATGYLIAGPAWIEATIAFSCRILTPLTLLLVGLMLMANGLVMISRKRKRAHNLVSLVSGILLVAGMIVVSSMMATGSLSPTSGSGAHLLLCVLLFFVFTFLAFALYSLVYALLPHATTCDYVIVCGAGLVDGYRPSRILTDRLSAAVELRRKSGEHCRIVVSGGQGPDEQVTEASAMRRWLQQHDVDDEDILIEDRSTTTLENLTFSKALIDRIGTQRADEDEKAEGGQRYTCLYVTNDFHLLRTGIYSKMAGLQTRGVGCRTVLWYWPGAFIREYFAVIHLYGWSFLIWLVLCAVMILTDLPLVLFVR